MYSLINRFRQNVHGAIDRAWQRFSTPRFSAAESALPGDRRGGPNATAVDDPYLRLPLPLILKAVPANLLAEVRNRSAEGVTIPIPIDWILPQLARGAVKLPFGAVRQAAPQWFSAGPEQDEFQIALPLGEILARLDARLLSRRSAQSQVRVPDHVVGPFERSNRDLTVAYEPASPPRRASSAKADTAQRSAPASSQAVPALPRLGSFSALDRRPPTTVEPSASATDGTRGRAQSPSRGASPLLVLPLAEMASDWPPALRSEIAEANLADARIALPLPTVRQGLKKGSLEFSWKTLRGWIQPAIPLTVSSHDAQVLALPLAVVAPAFLATQRSGHRSRSTLPVDQEIPDVFAAANPPAAPPLPDVVLEPARPSAARQEPEPEAQSTRPPEAQPPPAPVEPGSRAASPAAGGTGDPFLGIDYAASTNTPNGVVFRAAALPGVAGALIASAEGLTVASRVSGDLDGDALAAFLPQIFRRLNQCFRELRRGELTSLQLTLEKTPWALIRAGDNFFVAFGRPGESMPVNELAELAKALEQGS